jgi:hypothetical protein
MKSKIFTIATFSLVSGKLLDFKFFVDENLKRENICATIKEFMNDINPKYSIYVSPKIWDTDEIKTYQEIKAILEKAIKKPKDETGI